MQDMNNILKEVMTNLGTFSEETPEQMKAFHGFMEAVEKEGKLSKKTKELIALGSAITTHCEWCIALHVKGALDAGASREEILEAGWVATLMGGGPALMYFQYVLKALEDFRK